MGAHDPGNEFASALAEAITHRGLTLQAISARLASNGTPVSVPTLSYWQTGRSVPTRSRSIKGVEALEHVLELPPGALVQTLAGNPQMRAPIAVMPDTDVVPGLLAELGLTLDRNFQVITHEDQLDIGPDRVARSLTIRRVLRALRDKADRLPVIHQNEDAQGRAPEVVAIAGCQVGRRIQRDDLSLVACELVLPRPLRQGDHHLVEYRVDWPPTEVITPSFSRALPSTVTALVMEARFAEGTPTRAEHLFRESHEATSRVVRELPVSDHLVQLVGTDVQPGIHELVWHWD